MNKQGDFWHILGLEAKGFISAILIQGLKLIKHIWLPRKYITKLHR